MRFFWKMWIVIIGKNAEWVGKKGKNDPEMRSSPHLWLEISEVLERECKIWNASYRWSCLEPSSNSQGTVWLSPFFLFCFLTSVPSASQSRALGCPCSWLLACPPSPPAAVQVSAISSSWPWSQPGPGRSCTAALLRARQRPAGKPRHYLIGLWARVWSGSCSVPPVKGLSLLRLAGDARVG